VEKKVDPATAEVQALVDQWNEIALRYKIRNTMTALLEWNSSIARKYLQVGEQALSRTVCSVESASDQGLWAYFMAAAKASGWNQGLMQIADEAVMLVERKAEPSSAPAKTLVKRLAQICADHSLGDPAVYARWSTAMQRDDESADLDARRKAGWEFLTRAVQPQQ
jgi:hypothetical protein